MCFSTYQKASGALVMDRFLKECSVIISRLPSANNYSASLAGVILILCQLIRHSQRVFKWFVDSKCEDLQCSVVLLEMVTRFCTSPWAHCLPVLMYIPAFHQELTWLVSFVRFLDICSEDFQLDHWQFIYVFWTHTIVSWRKISFLYTILKFKFIFKTHGLYSSERKPYVNMDFEW